MKTRDQIGPWRTELVHNPSLRFVIGAEPNFLGLDNIKQNFRIALGKPFTIHDTMEKVVMHAVDLARPDVLAMP